MRNSLQAKLVASFLVVVVISGLTATIVGVRLIGRGIVRQAQEKVGMDLNSAREIYNHKLRDIENVIRFTAIRSLMREALVQQDVGILKDKLEEVRKEAHLDILTITDETGRVVLRSHNPERYGDSQADDELVSKVLTEK